jgi:hypothetical protein
MKAPDARRSFSYMLLAGPRRTRVQVLLSWSSAICLITGGILLALAIHSCSTA